MLGAIQGGLEILYTKIANPDTLQLAFVLERVKKLPQGFQFARGSNERVVDGEKIKDNTGFLTEDSTDWRSSSRATLPPIFFPRAPALLMLKD